MDQRMKNSKDKVIGTIKETAGQILDNDEMEFKGKVQTLKANLGNRMEDVTDKFEDRVEDLVDNISDGVKKFGGKVENAKSGAYSKANDFIDNIRNKD